jgi:hypothetical protein
MAKQAAEQFAEASTEVLSKSSEAADTAMRDTAAALTENGNASRAAIQQLTRAYQELATKNVNKRALATVKSPAEFIDTQQRLIKEGVETAISDSQQITQLTTAVFTAAFEPTKKQAEGQHIGRQ